MRRGRQRVEGGSPGRTRVDRCATEDKWSSPPQRFANEVGHPSRRASSAVCATSCLTPRCFRTCRTPSTCRVPAEPLQPPSAAFVAGLSDPGGVRDPVGSGDGRRLPWGRCPQTPGFKAPPESTGGKTPGRPERWSDSHYGWYINWGRGTVTSRSSSTLQIAWGHPRGSPSDRLLTAGQILEWQPRRHGRVRPEC